MSVWGGVGGVREDFSIKKNPGPDLAGEKKIQDRGKHYSTLCKRGKQKDRITSRKKKVPGVKTSAPPPPHNNNQMVAPLLGSHGWHSPNNMKL